MNGFGVTVPLLITRHGNRVNQIRLVILALDFGGRITTIGQTKIVATHIAMSVNLKVQTINLDRIGTLHCNIMRRLKAVA